MDKHRAIYIANRLGASYASLGRQYGVSAKRIKRICVKVEREDNSAWFVNRTLRNYQDLLLADISRNNSLLAQLAAA